MVAVQIGTGEHAGKLRLSEGGSHKLITWGGKSGRNMPAPSLRIALPAGVPAARHKGVAVTYEVHGSDLIVALPDFAKPTSLSIPTAVRPFRIPKTTPDFGRAGG